MLFGTYVLSEKNKGTKIVIKIPKERKNTKVQKHTTLNLSTKILGDKNNIDNYLKELIQTMLGS